MDYEKRFEQIREHLRVHEYLHSTEMMDRYPNKLPAPYDDWVKELIPLTVDELLEFERDFDTSKLKSKDLISFVKNCKVLSEIPLIKEEETKLSQNLTRKLSPKKQHEIQTIKTYVNNLNYIDNIIDIGSGAGHLSCALVANTAIQSYCLDMNSEFQEQGKKKINHWLPELKEKVHFIPHKLEAEKRYPFEINPNSTLTIGLHSCGPLSTYIVQSKPKNLLNFGCCYHKMIDEYNISATSKENAIHFTNHALTMAAKCMGTKTVDDLKTKYFVKRFRYPVHFFQVDNSQINVSPLGNAKALDYQGDFKEYIKKYCPELSKYDIPLKKNEVDYYFKAGSIRALLGRLIEIYIVLDRVLYLKENNLDAKVYQFFNPKLSPRNLGIII